MPMYWARDNYERLESFKNLSRKILLAENNNNWGGVYDDTNPSLPNQAIGGCNIDWNIHNGGANYLFLDGHTEWLPKNECDKIEAQGLKTSVLIYEGLNTTKKRTELSNEIKINLQFLTSLFNLVNLTRIQWVSPVFARMLVAAGYEKPETIAKADTEKLCHEVDQANKANTFFKGKIGLRDIKRLIKAASYVL